MSAWGAAAALYGVYARREAAVRSAEGAVKAAAVALTVSSAMLFAAFLRRDFSLEYVASYSDRTLSVFYTVGAFWAGHAGSLLLWAWVGSVYAAVVVHQNRSRHRDLMPYVVATLSAVTLLFAALVTFTSNPFKALPFTPLDGDGLNPMLQNYGQWVHPVATYLGYVGFTIPFAFCVAALATGNLGDVWVRIVRKWTLWAWLMLTAGIIFGARWAYVELGWGGYWAWDPVENASLLPWLTGTAYLHSVMIQEKRGMLKVWNVSLASATFALSLFGTFIVRSGLVSSVHAFAQSPVGPYLIAATAAVVLVSGTLIAWRLPELRGRGSIQSLASREASFLLNNLLLVAVAFTVFWGTIFPLVAESVRGVKVSVGPPFFDAVVSPMGIALLALMGFCPLLAWRKASIRNLKRNFLVPAVPGLASLAVFASLTPRRPGLVVVLSLAVFVLVTIATELYRGIRARHRLLGEGWGTALRLLVSRNPRRYGGYMIHVGVVVVLASITIHVSFKSEMRQTLSAGETVRVGSYSLALDSIEAFQTPAKSSTVATLRVFDARGSTLLGTMRSERSLFANQDQPVSEVGIRSTLIEDLYVILESADEPAGVASFAFLVNPGVFWIWAGMVTMLAGGLVVAWPQRRPREEVSDRARPRAYATVAS